MRKQNKLTGTRISVISVAAFAVFASWSALHSAGYEDLLKKYETEAGQALDAASGQKLYEKKNADKSCTDCHKKDITKDGSETFLFLSKRIRPMALSANPKAFKDATAADKEFNKNCKKVFGRLCTAKEKGDMLLYFTKS